MNRQIYSVRNQLLLWLVVPSIFLWVVGGFGAYWIAAGLTQSTFDDALEDSARILASRIRIDGDQTQLDISPEALAVLRADPVDLFYFQVRDAGGRIIAGDEGIPLPEARAAAPPIGFRNGQMRGEAVRICSFRFLPKKSQPDREITIQIAETMHSRAQVIANTLEIIAPALVLIVALAGLAAWFGVRRGLAPIERVRETVASRSYFDLGRINIENPPTEVRPLIDEINSLLSRLEEGKDLHQRFIENAAHQLRTPLAALKAQFQLALRDQQTIESVPALMEIAAGLDRVTRLVSQLLSLARAQPGAIQLHQDQVDLEQIVKESARELAPQATRKQIDIGFEGTGRPVPVYGDGMALRDLVTNLIDNAVRYTPAGGSITVRMASAVPPVFSVEDNGPGIPDNELELVFERFYRGRGGARAEGTGLGLAIVQEIAVRHGADISLENRRDSSGLIVSVKFTAESGIDVKNRASRTGQPAKAKAGRAA